MRRVYLDTIGLLALWNARDQWHEVAVRVLGELTAGGADFWTSTPVLLECGNAAARTPFRRAVAELRQHLLADGKLIVPNDDDCAGAWEAYARGAAGEAGIVDQVSFAVMRRLGFAEAFTNDRHFRAAGFDTLL
jgi:predicted nucleic acid-binding protein